MSKRASPPLDTLYADKVLAEAVDSTRGMRFVGRSTVLNRYSLRIYFNEIGERVGVAWLLFAGKDLIGTGRLLMYDGFARAGIAVIASEYRRKGIYAAVLRVLRKKLGVPIESDVSMTAGAIGAWKKAGGKITDRSGDKVFRINSRKSIVDHWWARPIAVATWWLGDAFWSGGPRPYRRPYRLIASTGRDVITDHWTIAEARAAAHRFMKTHTDLKATTPYRARSGTVRIIHRHPDDTRSTMAEWTMTGGRWGERSR